MPSSATTVTTRATVSRATTGCSARRVGTPWTVATVRTTWTRGARRRPRCSAGPGSSYMSRQDHLWRDGLSSTAARTGTRASRPAAVAERRPVRRGRRAGRDRRADSGRRHARHRLRERPCLHAVGHPLDPAREQTRATTSCRSSPVPSTPRGSAVTTSWSGPAGTTCSTGATRDGQAGAATGATPASTPRPGAAPATRGTPRRRVPGSSQPGRPPWRHPAPPAGLALVGPPQPPACRLTRGRARLRPWPCTGHVISTRVAR